MSDGLSIGVTTTPRRWASAAASSISMGAKCSAITGFNTSPFISRVRVSPHISSANASGRPSHSHMANHWRGLRITIVMKPSAVSNNGYTTVVPDRTMGGSIPASNVGCMLASCQVLR